MEMLIIFVILLICTEKMWNKSMELRGHYYGRKMELLTLLGGTLILGIGEIFVPIQLFKCVAQETELDKILTTYVILVWIIVLSITQTIEGMKKFKRNDDKLFILGISLTSLLIGYAVGLIR